MIEFKKLSKSYVQTINVVDQSDLLISDGELVASLRKWDSSRGRQRSAELIDMKRHLQAKVPFHVVLDLCAFSLNKFIL